MKICPFSPRTAHVSLIALRSFNPFRCEGRFVLASESHWLESGQAVPRTIAPQEPAEPPRSR